MKRLKTGSLIAIALLVTMLLTNFRSEPDPRLLSIRNLDNFYYVDMGYEVGALTEHNKKQGKKVKSIVVYRFSTAAQAMIMQDSIILDREGKAIIKYTPMSGSFITNYYYYDVRGNCYLEMTILSNNYDTLYTMKSFDDLNRAMAHIKYNATRNELDNLTFIDVLPVSDSEIQLESTRFHTDFTYKTELPFEGRKMNIKLLNDTLVSVSTQRTVYSDTSYNSSYAKQYLLKDGILLPEGLKIHCFNNASGDWVEKEIADARLQRRFYYYAENEDEVKIKAEINPRAEAFLRSQMDSLPTMAWMNLENLQNSMQERINKLEEGLFGDSIGVIIGDSLREFLPELWYEVSANSGYINGFDSLCYVVGYNTPISGNDGNYKRCLAIFEFRNGKYHLVKQSFGAIDGFYDSDEDLFFDGYDETNFSVSIEEGNIFIQYEYMRGEAHYEYACENGMWILVSWGSGHRTCCNFEHSGYDYRTKTYTYSLSNFGEEEENDDDFPADTSVTRIEERPIIYMDDEGYKE